MAVRPAPLSNNLPRSRAVAAHGLLGLAVLLALPTTGTAATRCVSNAYQLASALAEVRTATDALFLIRVRTGIYQVTSLTGPFEVVQTHSNQLVDISGGWSGDNNGCTTQSRDPSLTTLVGSTTKPALSVYAGVPQSIDPGAEMPYGATVNVFGLTLKNPNFTKAYVTHADQEDFPLDYWEPESACLNALVGLETNEMLLERLDIRDCRASNNGNATGVIRNIGASLTMRNISARQSSSLGNAGLSVSSEQGGVSRLSQISITGMNTNPSCQNPATSNTFFYLDKVSGLDLRATEGGINYLGNSVVWGNTSCNAAAPQDVWLVLGFWDDGNPYTSSDNVWVEGSGGDVWLDHVHMGHIKVWTPFQLAHTTNLSYGDPLFVAAGNPMPRAGSPLIDAGNASPQGGTGGYDASGRTRVLGGHVDIGAYETQPNQTPTLVLASQYTVAALAPASTLVFTAAAVDDGMPGPLSYSLSSNCAGMFAINGATGVVRLAAANSPFGGSCDVTVTVSDGALQTSASTTVVLQPEVSDEIFVDDFEL